MCKQASGTDRDSRSTATRQPASPPTVWGDVPPRNINFVGRTELIERLHGQFATGDTAQVVPAALHGMGGIGKTQTAVEYIYRHLDDYDLVWWIQAAQATQIRSGLTELGRQLGLPGSSDVHTAVPAVLDALRLGDPVGRWLLVFDAAEDPEMVRKYFPASGPGEVLVTSRNPAWGGIATPLEVTSLRREESKELLGRRCAGHGDNDADQLANILGDLPLAIEQAAAWRVETGMPVRDYLRLLEGKVAELSESSTTSDYDVPLAAAWNVSFDELRDRNPAAHQILLICAFFSPEPFSRDLFSCGSGVAVSPELDVTLRDPIQLARAIRDINRYGLARVDHGSNTIQLHCLVQLVLRNRVDASASRSRMRHGAHLLLANLDPGDPDSRRNWPRYRELLSHVHAADVVHCDDRRVRRLVINLMRYLFLWGDHQEAVELARHAYVTFTEKLGQNDSQTLEAARHLGLYLWGLGRFREAAELNQRTLERRIQMSGENSEETIGVRHNILADLKARGDFPAARRLSEEILHRSRTLLGPDDPGTLEAAYLHGISLRLTGDFGAARELDEDTHRKRAEVLGRDHPQTQSSFVASVVDRRDAGEYSWARAESEKLVGWAAEELGMDNAVTWMRLHLLSIARRKDGDHRGAFELSGPVLHHFRHRYGSGHPTTIGSVLARSVDLRHDGTLDEARLLGEEAFASYRGLFGEHHPHTLAAMVDLAVTLRLDGDAAGAKALDQRAFEQLRIGLGADHPSTVACGINLASDLAALGETDAAIQLGQQMRDRSRDSLGDDHPTTVAAQVNLVADLRMAGRQFSDAGAPRRGRASCDIDPLIL